MLRFLRIGHLAVIDAAELEFEPGFNVLTGETGAGKSILVEAVGLLLGGRASGDLVRTGEELATVEAIVQHGDREILVRREVTAHGRSRSFVDGVLVTATALRERMDGLVELHGQHEHQTLLDPETHLGAVDLFGGLEADVAQVGQQYAAWRTAVDEERALVSEAKDRAAHHELAAYQLQDIQRADIRRIDEDDELVASRRVLTNAARLQQLCAESYAGLYERDDAALSTLAGVWRRVVELAAIDPVFEQYVAARDGIKGQLEDLAAALRRYQDGLDVSPARVQQVEDRLAVLERLKKKYGPTLGDVITKRDELIRALQSLDSFEERLSEHQATVRHTRQAFVDAASKLGLRRRDTARVFAQTLVDLLDGLALERAAFEIRFNADPLEEGAWGPQGTDRAEFFISPNPGEDLRPLARIVSGGELSRIMLALKTMIFRERLLRAGASAPLERHPGSGAPVMIFDEVDAGLGGRVAEIVGRRLRDLGAAFQVLCITHLPQVAAHADTHFVIEKGLTAGRTETRVRRLTAEHRVDELARMLAGSARSDAVIASARELLARGTTATIGGSEANTKSTRTVPSPTKKRRAT